MTVDRAPAPDLDAADLEVALGAAVDEGVGPNVRRWLAFRGIAPGEWIELQALDVPDGRFSQNRFAHAADAETLVRLLEEADRWKPPCQGVYQIGNCVDPAVATRRGPNKWHVAKKGESTSDREMRARAVVFVDVDAERPKGTSATEAQVRDTHAVASAIFNDLARLLAGAASLALGHSGNGRALFIALDHLVETDELAATVKGVLSAIRARHETLTVKIDPSVSDAKRLMPAFGTTKRKGATGIAERPHRRTGIVTLSGATDRIHAVRRLSAGELTELLHALRRGLSDAQQEDVDRAMGRRPVTPLRHGQPRPLSGPHALGPDLFAIANDQIPIGDVLAWLGLGSADAPVCPGCGLTGDSSVAIVGNGLKCLHARCSRLGVPGREGFRSVVDVVMEARQLDAKEALELLREHFPRPFPAAPAAGGRVLPFRAPAPGTAPTSTPSPSPAPTPPQASAPANSAAEAVPPSAPRPSAPIPASTPAPTPSDPEILGGLIGRLALLDKPSRAPAAMAPEVIAAAADLDELTSEWATLRAQLKALGVPLTYFDRAVRVERRRRAELAAAAEAAVESRSSRAIAAAGRVAAGIADAGEAWQRELVYQGREIRNSYRNLVLVLRHTYGATLRYNEMRFTPELADVPLRDEDASGLREEVEARWGLTPSNSNVKEAVRQVACERRYHPVQQYLRSLAWDGHVRIPHVAKEILGTPPTALTQRMIHAWFVSAVARGLRPGCRNQVALVLVGEQGLFKSTFFEVLAGEWFSDTHMDITAKDGLLQLAAAWIYEWGEIDKITTERSASTVKAFMASARDNFRPPFAAANIQNPRSSVIVGSTNKTQYLNDPTGSRRFWTIPITQYVNQSLLRAWRDQLWAEAVQAFDGGCTWWLEREDDAAREDAASEYQVEVPLDAVIARWIWSEEGRRRVIEKGFFTIGDILISVLKLEPGKWEHQHEVKVGHSIVRLERAGGWQRVRPTVNGVRQRGYVPPPEPPAFSSPATPLFASAGAEAEEGGVGG